MVANTCVLRRNIIREQFRPWAKLFECNTRRKKTRKKGEKGRKKERVRERKMFRESIYSSISYIYTLAGWKIRNWFRLNCVFRLNPLALTKRRSRSGFRDHASRSVSDTVYVSTWNIAESRGWGPKFFDEFLVRRVSLFQRNKFRTLCPERIETSFDKFSRDIRGICYHALAKCLASREWAEQQCDKVLVQTMQFSPILLNILS